MYLLMMDSDDTAHWRPGHSRSSLGRSTSSLPGQRIAQNDEDSGGAAAFIMQQPNIDSKPSRPARRPVSQPATMESFAGLFGVLPDQRIDGEHSDLIDLSGEEQDIDLGQNQTLAGPSNAAVFSDDAQASETNQADKILEISFLEDNEDPSKLNLGESFARQFRQTRKLQDEALIKRTQWTQELDTLAHSSAYLMNTTAELMSHLSKPFVINTMHPKERQRTKKRAERTEAILRENPKRAGDLVSPPTTIDSTDSSGEKAQSASDSGLGSSRPELVPDSHATKVFAQYCKDYDAVMEQEEIVKRLTNELSNLEYRLEQKQREMKARMSTQSQKLAAELRSEMLTADLDVSESSMPARTGTETPPMVRKYFDRQGDVGIWRERLVELDYAHEEGKMEREFLRDRGDPVDPPDFEFDLNYRSRREHILDQLRSAETEAAMLRKECEAAGLNTEFHRESMLYLQSEGSPAPSARELFDREHSPSPVYAQHFPAPIPSYTLQERSAKRIDEWLHDLPATSISGEPG